MFAPILNTIQKFGGLLICALGVVLFADLALADDDIDTTTIPLFLPVLANDHPGALKALTQLLAEQSLDQITVTTSEHWHRYQQGLRHGRVGLYLAPPHFAAWAIAEHNFVPLLRIDEALSYVIATRRSDASIFEMSDLNNRRVCAEKPLNLDYLLVNQAFEDSLMSANIHTVASVAIEMQRSNSDCDGFAVSNHIFTQLEIDFPRRFIRLYQSGLSNNYVFVAHPQVPSLLRQKLAAALSEEGGTQALAPILAKFASRNRLVRAQVSDYPASYSIELERYWRP